MNPPTYCEYCGEQVWFGWHVKNVLTGAVVGAFVAVATYALIRLWPA